MMSPLLQRRFKVSLDQHYQWPARYTFKFVVPGFQEQKVKDLVGVEVGQRRPSRTGRHVGLTFQRQVSSGDEVIAIYQRVSELPGVVAL